MKEQPTTISHALREAYGDDGYHVDEAVNAIFARPGSKYAFLFNQNARRTNVQMAELLSLLRLHAFRIDTRTREQDLEFISIEEVKRFLSDLVEHGQLGIQPNLDQFVKQVADYFEDKVLIEALHGSMAIFLPPHIDVNLALICGESGYIHSCGDLLLLRNAEKVSERFFKDAIASCIGQFGKEGSSFLLVPFCHEDFSQHDRESTPFLQYGLDDVKLNMSKAFVGATKLYDLLDEIGNEFEEKLMIAPAGDFRSSSDTFSSRFPEMSQETIFLITDSDLDSTNRFPGRRKFYLVYRQVYKNNNPYHLYDENKPGWASHTTLPHSLAGAMINLARPWFRDVGQAKIADPFGGSGTIFFETQKIAGLDCQSSDRAPIFQYVVKDNSEFFSLGLIDKVSLQRKLAEFSEVVPDTYSPKGRRSRETNAQKLARISEVVRGWAARTNGDFLKLDEESLASGFKSIGESLHERLLAYVGLRASVRGITDIDRGTATWPAFFKKELGDLLRQMKNETKRLDVDAQMHPLNERMLMGRAAYSASTSPRAPEIEQHDLLGSLHFERASVEALPRDTYDAIITDPPYGFNTDEDYWQMAEFVGIMIDSLLRALKPTGGQLILAAPSVSFSGKGIMPFVRSDFLARKIVQTAAKQGKECVKPSVVLPSSLVQLEPPYYWVAEKSLERRILHFWVRERATLS